MGVGPWSRRICPGPAVATSYFMDTSTRSLQTVAGLFQTQEKVHLAQEKLLNSGFPKRSITTFSPNRTLKGHREFNQGHTSIWKGVILGGTLGFLIVGISVFLSTMSSSSSQTWVLLTVTGCLVGAIVGAAFGALVGIGTPKLAAKRFGLHLAEGGTVLTVQLAGPELQRLAIQQFEEAGAKDISVLNEQEFMQQMITEKRRLLARPIEST